MKRRLREVPVKPPRRAAAGQADGEYALFRASKLEHPRGDPHREGFRIDENHGRLLAKVQRQLTFPGTG